jgi:hypothetical protein
VRDDPRVIEAYFGTGGIDMRRPLAAPVGG